MHAWKTSIVERETKKGRRLVGLRREFNAVRGGGKNGAKKPQEIFPGKAACTLPSSWKNMWGLGQSTKLRNKCEGKWGCSFTPGRVFGGTCTSISDTYEAHNLPGFSDLVNTLPHTQEGFLARLESPLRKKFHMDLLDASKQQEALTELKARTNWWKCAQELQLRNFNGLEFQDRNVLPRIEATLAAQQYYALQPDVTETALKKRLQGWRKEARGTYKGAQKLLSLQGHELQALQAHFTARGWSEDLDSISQTFTRQRNAAEKRRKALAFPSDLSPYYGSVYLHDVHLGAPMPTLGELTSASLFNVTIQLRFINRFPDFRCVTAMSAAGISRATVVLTSDGPTFQPLDILLEKSTAELHGVELAVTHTNTNTLASY